jgi:hypothetical protein
LGFAFHLGDGRWFGGQKYRLQGIDGAQRHERFNPRLQRGLAIVLNSLDRAYGNACPLRQFQLGHVLRKPLSPKPGPQFPADLWWGRERKVQHVSPMHNNI